MAKTPPKPKRKHAATPPPMEATKGNLHKPEPESETKSDNRVPFNLKVPEEFLNRLRRYAKRSQLDALDQGGRGVTMTDVVVKCVEEFLAKEGL